LVVFDVLLIESSVTRAAERLGRTQSTFGHSLSRLRRQFGNPLLTKGGMRMQPTAFARPMLGGIQRVLSPAHIFARATVAAGILD
jgi:DNA-binding transcriptional LysR family regulator